MKSHSMKLKLSIQIRNIHKLRLYYPSFQAQNFKFVCLSMDLSS